MRMPSPSFTSPDALTQAEPPADPGAGTTMLRRWGMQATAVAFALIGWVSTALTPGGGDGDATSVIPGFGGASHRVIFRAFGRDFGDVYLTEAAFRAGQPAYRHWLLDPAAGSAHEVPFDARFDTCIPYAHDGRVVVGMVGGNPNQNCMFDLDAGTAHWIDTAVVEQAQAWESARTGGWRGRHGVALTRPLPTEPPAAVAQGPFPNGLRPFPEYRSRSSSDLPMAEIPLAWAEDPQFVSVQRLRLEDGTAVSVSGAEVFVRHVVEDVHVARHSSALRSLTRSFTRRNVPFYEILLADAPGGTPRWSVRGELPTNSAHVFDGVYRAGEDRVAVLIGGLMRTIDLATGEVVHELKLPQPSR